MTPTGPEGLLVFKFMGIESEIVTANGVGRKNCADIMKVAIEKIQDLAKAW